MSITGFLAFPMFAYVGTIKGFGLKLDTTKCWR